MTGHQCVLLEREGGIATLTFNRPRVRNAIDPATVAALGRCLTALEGDAGLRGVVVTGAGGSFVSGGDLKALHQASPEEAHRAVHLPMVALLNRLEALPVPVICALEGYALGGGAEIALACDLRVAAKGAKIGFRQVRVGVSPGWGGSARLLALVGRSRSLRLLWEARDMSGEEALGLGLVDELVEDGLALDTAMEMARGIAKGPPLAVAGVKALFAREAPEARVGLGGGTLPQDSYHDMAARELRVFQALWASEDHDEAVRAHQERRAPVYKGR